MPREAHATVRRRVQGRTASPSLLRHSSPTYSSIRRSPCTRTYAQQDGRLQTRVEHDFSRLYCALKAVLQTDDVNVHALRNIQRT
jgi:hypothetical protein